EPFAGELVADGLREAGVDIRFNTTVSSLTRDNSTHSANSANSANGEIRITLSDGGQLTADEILLATGRAPQTRDLGLETVGLTPGDWLTVDDTFQVTGIDGGWLYAVGDVNRRALMTHQGKYQARIAGAA
ncbi:pyridine nucleotide-disulfide oxidoreductase, partial [Streptomyces sp. AS58]|uniref:FAD-dependent oxidoreductase n=1 Tax=Streptomyces sp. AS58 TaxID=1519489 RepID=UPI0006C50C48